MPRLRNPVSGTEDDFTEGQARVRRRKGWLDVPDEPPESDGVPDFTVTDVSPRWGDRDPYRTSDAEASEDQE